MRWAEQFSRRKRARRFLPPRSRRYEPPRDFAEARIRGWRRLQHWLYPPRRRPRDPHVSVQRLDLKRLPAALSGLRIVQLSDIHYGMYLSHATMTRILELTTALEPDLIALTGDFVTQSPVFIDPVCDLLGRLRAPLGVYAVLGNHDFRAGAERVAAGLRRHGIRVLRNEHCGLSVRGCEIRLAGIDDSRQHPDLASALRPLDPERFTILLAHNPVVLGDAAALGVDFVLCGHTHGGQIKLPFAAHWYRRHAPEGLLELGRTRMYVSRGLGQVILPVRVGSPPELVAFDLFRGD